MNRKLMWYFCIKLYDKLILSILFSAFFMASCDEPDIQPQPEYGVKPMYGPVSTTITDNNIKEQSYDKTTN